MDNQIIKINTDTDGKQTVNARELHEFLEVETRFNDWIERRIIEYGFIINTDFCSFLSKSSGGRPAMEYHITIDMAKELSMVERNEKGKQARKYFIEMERVAKGAAQTQQIPSQLREIVEIKLLTTEFLKKHLNYSEPSVLKLIYDIHQEHNISTGYLPHYVENQRVSFSLTDLLQKHGLNLSAQAMNQKMISAGFLEEKQRRSTSSKTGYKKFKALTQAGLLFGHNDVSPKNRNEVVPKYYEDTFNNLLKEVLNEN